MKRQKSDTLSQQPVMAGLRPHGFGLNEKLSGQLSNLSVNFEPPYCMLYITLPLARKNFVQFDSLWALVGQHGQNAM